LIGHDIFPTRYAKTNTADRCFHVLLPAGLIKTKDFINQLYSKKLTATAAVGGLPKSSGPDRRESRAAMPPKIVAFRPAQGAYTTGGGTDAGGHHHGNTAARNGGWKRRRCAKAATG